MFDSIYKDIRYSFSQGNMVTRLIIINVAICILITLFKAFSPPSSGIFDSVLSNIAIPGSFYSFIYKPWTAVTSMFVHIDLWHLLVNMLYLFWFGRIVGDLIGDRHILPLYIYGGLAGNAAYMLSYYVLGSSVIGSIAIGASAAVMSLVIVAGIIAPDYILRLILIGEVRLKYVVLVIIVLDLLAISRASNTGGHIAHLGGLLMGYVYIRSLQGGFLPFSKEKPSRNRKPIMKKVHRHVNTSSTSPRKDQTLSPQGNLQEQVDQILDKIKASGYDSLTAEEKETLFIASKSDT